MGVFSVQAHSVERRVERNTRGVDLNGCARNADGKEMSHDTDQKLRPCSCCTLPGGPERHVGAGTRRTRQFSHRGPLSASAGRALAQAALMVLLFRHDRTGGAAGILGAISTCSLNHVATPTPYGPWSSCRVFHP